MVSQAWSIEQHDNGFQESDSAQTFVCRTPEESEAHETSGRSSGSLSRQFVRPVQEPGPLFKTGPRKGITGPLMRTVPASDIDHDQRQTRLQHEAEVVAAQKVLDPAWVRKLQRRPGQRLDSELHTHFGESPSARHSD